MVLTMCRNSVMRCGRCMTYRRALTAAHTRNIITTPRCYAPRGGKGNHEKGNPFINYIRRLKWVPIPVGVGFAYIGYQQLGHVIKREEIRQETANPEDLVAKDWLVRLYRCLPLKILSRAWGRLNDLQLPMWMREPVLKAYIWAFDCDLDEAAIRDLKHYRNLGEFFNRRLRYGARTVDQSHCLTCPSDGKVLYFGKAKEGALEQVKGLSYSLQTFLGPPSWKDGSKMILGYNEADSVHKLSEGKYHREVKQSSDRDLYHCVIYLAPGNYHGFHSPADWTVTRRRHFPGELFSVSPGIARLVKGLFNINERVVYFGEWEQGFFSMVAVGATNVGSMKIYHDKDLETNCPFKYDEGCYFDHTFAADDKEGTVFLKGEAFGEFNLGSTIVLVFEAPRDFQFKIEPGQKIKYGQPLGCYKLPKPNTGA